MEKTINMGYLDTACIKNMGEPYISCIKKLVEDYGEFLSDRIVLNDSVYTPHNFNEHCYDIYKIISNVLLDDQLAYDSSYSLSKRELYILNLAVLFHDISMSRELTVNRKNHSIKSADYVEEEWNKQSSLRKNGQLNRNEVYALKEIIIAHSNIRDENLPDSENGLNAPNLKKEFLDKDGKPIRTLFLAGILRVADEMDVTSDRLGNNDLGKEIEKYTPIYEKGFEACQSERDREDFKKIEVYMESLDHWKKLNLFSAVRNKPNNPSVVELVVDDFAFKRELQEGSSFGALQNTILDVFRNVENRLDEAIKIAFEKSSNEKIIKAKSVELYTENEELKNAIYSIVSRRSLNKNIEKKQEAFCPPNALIKDKLIDSEVADCIKKEVIKRELLSFGHFRLNSEFCARDWINTKEIVETRQINMHIVKAISRHIDESFVGDYTIMGVGLVGTILASRVSFALQTPLSYVIPEKDDDNNSEFEKKIDIPQNTEIILITDVIVTYEAINTIKEKYLKDNKIIAIYSVFYRQSDWIPQNELTDITYFLNDDFPIELFEKKNCKYETCKAVNQTVNSIVKEKNI